MAQAVGALNVSLGLNSAQFQTGLKNAQSSLTRFSSTVKTAMAGLAAALAPTAIAAAFKKTIDHADAMGKAAQKIGIPVEELSKLRHAANLSGVSMETLSTSMGRLSRAMAESIGKDGGQAKQAFDALGVSVRNADGSMKSSSQVFSEVAEKLSKFRDGANKTAIAMALFGRGGAELIPLLNAGATGIESMKKEAEELGLVITNNTAKSAENFNDNLTRLSSLISGVFLQATNQIAPVLERISAALLDAAKNSNGFQVAAEAVASVMLRLVEFGASVIRTMREIGAVISGIAAAGVAARNFDLDGVKSAFSGVGDEIARTKKEHEGFVNVLRLPSISHSGVLAAFGLGGGGVSQPDAPNPFEKAGKAAKAGVEKLTEAEREAARLYQKLKSEAESLYESTRTPLEAFRDQMEKLQKMLVGEGPGGTKNPLISQETYTRAVAKAQEDLNKALIAGNEYAQSMVSTLNSWFDGLMNGTLKLRDAVRKLVQDFAKIAMNKVFTQLVGAMFGGAAGGGGFFAGLFGGARASGGPISGGRAYLVGERGPELVVPRSDGTVIPNHALGARQQNVNINVNVDGANGDQHVMQLVQQGVTQGLRSYDQTLPNRLQDIQNRRF